jgi:hypothetical protein
MSYPSLHSTLSFRPVIGEAGFVPLPVMELAEDEDEAAGRAEGEHVGYEVDASLWTPLPCSGTARRPPVRFVDGGVGSETVGVIRYDGVYRPLLLGSLGALELIFDHHRLQRPPSGWRAKVAAALVANGIPDDLVEAVRSELAELGISLFALRSDGYGPNFEILRRRTWDALKNEMEAMERSLLLSRPDVPTVADGLLERRLTTLESQRQPVVGMVKRNLRQYLPRGQAAMLYDLGFCQRSPAFMIRTDHGELVSWYLRLSANGGGPGAGLIRLAAPREYLEREFPDPSERFAELSAVSAWICSLRCRQESYARHAVSLEPVVRVEDQLHALMPSIHRHASAVRLRLARS